MTTIRVPYGDGWQEAQIPDGVSVQVIDPACEPVETPVEYLRIGGAGLIGIRPEICARTLAEIRQCVGLEVLGLVSFVNGGQKCMPDLTCYDNCAYQAKNSMFAAGTAEQFAKDIVNMIREQE